MTVLYIVILIYFNFNIMSIVNVFMLSIERKKTLLFLASIEIVIAKFPHLEFLQLPRVFLFFFAC